MTCVFCNSPNDLNTQITVTLDDGSKVKVDICDEHAEDATVKTARAAYMRRQDAINAVLEQARALGLNVSEPTGPSGLVIAQEIPKPVSALTKQAPQVPNVQSPQRAPTKNDDLENDPDVVSTDRLDSHRGMRSVGGSAGNTSVESLPSHDIDNLKEKLNPDARKGVAKMGIAEGRAGQPIIIPKVRKDGTGTTRVNIVKTSDNMLQESFKKMAQDSIQDRVPDFARSGYSNTTRTCPICKGNCEVNGQICPKCDGNGIINVY